MHSSASLSYVSAVVGVPAARLASSSRGWNEAAARRVPTDLGRIRRRGHSSVIASPPLTRATAATAAASTASWATLDELTAPVDIDGYNLRVQQVPSSAPDPSLPTDVDSSCTEDKRVLLYRDTNAWCPFCERVWLALLEKDIPFDTVFIDLRWGLECVPLTLESIDPARTRTLRTYG